MFGISGTELIILAIITFVVIGPERMPEYARQIREFVKTVRRMAFDAKDDFKEPWARRVWKILTGASTIPASTIRA